MRSLISGVNQEDSTAIQRISKGIQEKTGISKFSRTKSKHPSTLVLLFVCGWLAWPLAAPAATTPDNATFQSDVQQVVKLRLRQQKLITREILHPTTPAEAQELATLNDQITKLRDKYYSTRLREKFKQQADELFKQEFVPACRQWVEEDYPDPQEVMKAYPNEPERAAALYLMRGILLGANDGWHQGKAAAYDAALNQIKTEQEQQGLKLTSEGLTRQQWVLVKHAYAGQHEDADAWDFQLKLFEQFLPGEAAKMKGDQATVIATAKNDRNRALFNLASFAVLLLMLLGMLIVPWLFAGRGDKSRFGMAAAATDGADPQTLPETLQMVKVPRLEYPVAMESGEVIDEKTWSETHIHVSTSGGGSRVVGNQVIHDPIQHHTSSTVVQKDRVWLRNLRNEQSVRTFSGGDFLTRQGQILSFLLLPLSGGDHRTLLAYNHTTGSSKLFSSTLGFAHKLKGLPLWGMMMGTAVLGAFLVRMLLLHTITSWVDIRNLNKALILWLTLAAMLSLIYVGVIKLIYSSRRNRAFNRDYLPAYRQFLEKLTPELTERFRVTNPTITPPQ